MGTPFLIYHRIIRDHEELREVSAEEAPYCITMESFEGQLEYLATKGIKTISIGEFIQKRQGSAESLKNTVVLTFDDGHQSDFAIVYPLLRRYNLKATFFITVGQVGQPGRLDWEEIGELARAGMEIGSHTMSHPYLPLLGREDIRQEFGLSKDILSEKLGREIELLALPYGFENREILSIASACDYLAVCTSKMGINDASTDIMSLRRIGIKSGWQLKEFEAIFRQDRAFMYKRLLIQGLKSMLIAGIGLERWWRLRRGFLNYKYNFYLNGMPLGTEQEYSKIRVEKEVDEETMEEMVWVRYCIRCGSILKKKHPWETIVCKCGWEWVG